MGVSHPFLKLPHFFSFLFFFAHEKTDCISDGDERETASSPRSLSVQMDII